MAARGDDRLERKDHAAVVQRAHHLVGDGHGAATLGVAPFAGRIENRPVGAAVAREIERLQRPGRRGLRIAGMLRQQHRAD